MVFLALKLPWASSQVSHMRFRDFYDFLHEIKSKAGKFENQSSRRQESWFEKQVFTNKNSKILVSLCIKCVNKDAKYGNSNEISTKEYLKALKMFVYSTASETHRT